MQLFLGLEVIYAMIDLKRRYEYIMRNVTSRSMSFEMLHIFNISMQGSVGGGDTKKVGGGADSYNPYINDYA